MSRGGTGYVAGIRTIMRPEAAALPLDEYIQSPMHGPTPCIHIQSQAPLQRQTPYRCKL